MSVDNNEAVQVSAALSDQRLAALLEKVGKGKATRADIRELQGNPETNALLPAHLQQVSEKPPEPARPPLQVVERPLPTLRALTLPNADAFFSSTAPQPTRNGLPLFDSAAARAPRIVSPERLWLEELAIGCFRPRPTEPLWQWATHEVWLDEKMSPKPGFYDIKLTPWTKEWQELPMNDRGIRLGVAMKDARSGFTEASLNVLRWMPEHWPGGALYAINSRDKAREVAGKRLLTTLARTAAARMSDDDSDVTLSKVSLTNMEIVISGSGSWGPFMEAWYRLIILDELESHIQDQDTTTLQRALSRQTDVPDGLTLAPCKPERAGGIIDLAYISGSQKRYFVPCPRCGRIIQLTRKNLVYAHCEEGDNGWNLERLLKDCWWKCSLCDERFEDHEKYDMVNSDLAKWIHATPLERRRPPSGKYVPPDPTVESYHMSSYYSLHERSRAGDLARELVMAHYINTSDSAKKYFITNFEGLPWESETYSISDESIRALIAGRDENKTIKTPEGDKIISEVITHPILRTLPDGSDRATPDFKLAYIRGNFQIALPFRPHVITMFTDKQWNLLKYLVFAVHTDGTPFLIDMGQVQDEDEWLTLFERPYKIEGLADPMFITYGLFDARHRQQAVYRACIKAYRKFGVQVWPAKGEGDNRKDDENKTGNRSIARKLFRMMKDYVDGLEIMVRYFHDYGIKSEFYFDHIQNRDAPRPYLPTDVPQALINEWTSEKYDRDLDEWIHNFRKFGPNDYGDCGKLYYVWLHENMEKLPHLKNR